MSNIPSITVRLRAVATLLILTLAGFGAAPRAAAQNSSPPERMTYQGFLADGNGVALATNAPKNYDVEFRIHDAPTGGSNYWAETQTVTVDKGYFSVLLGEGTALTPPGLRNLSTVFAGTTASERYVEMTVKGIGAGGTPVTMLPRIRLLTSPYSYLAQNAVNLTSPNGSNLVTTANGALTIKGTVSAGALTSSGAITGVTVAAAAVTASGTITASSFTGNGTIPVGGIIMWSGAIINIPAGWALCDGSTNSGQKTPDLKNRFIVSTGSGYTNNQTGGFDSIKLNDDQVPLRAHTHSVLDRFDADALPAGATVVPGADEEPTGDSVARYQITRTTSSTNLVATVPFDNRPQFYALAFIMRVQ